MFNIVAYEGVIRTGQMKTVYKFQVCACKRIHGKRFCWIYSVAKSHPPPKQTQKAKSEGLKYIKPREKPPITIHSRMPTMSQTKETLDSQFGETILS